MTLATHNKTIEILPEHIIDQIKAGEVLERPASLLKELIENSLDAGSTEIYLHLIENGMDLLSIEDNGHGMNFKNLPYAFLRHATSKLKTFEDLYRLHSFGFRGEALASVAASARLTCTTQPEDLTQEGGKIIINGGHTELLIAQRSSTPGTSIYIKDLFFNTPARLKFIKSKTSEKSALKKIIYSFVLSNPQVTFTIKWDEKEKEIFKAVDTQNNSERIAQVYFARKSESNNVVFAEQTYENYNVKVYFTRETHSTPQYRHHYLFVNKRFFQDKSLHSAVLRNLDSFWHFGESGHYVVEINTPAEDIDVNVHPNKTQIKFMRSDVVYSLLVTSLKAGVKNLLAESPATINSENHGGIAQSFFSRDENQSFDLMNMSQDLQSSTGESYNLFNRESANSAEAPIFQHLQDQYLIADIGKHLVVDLKKLIIHYFSEELHHFLLSDESAGPLLISEPFKMLKGKIDSHLEDLKNLGFEFDRLNAEYIVLRTIPRFLPQVLLFSLTETLVHFISQPKVETFERSAFKKYFEEHFPLSMLTNVPEHIIEKALMSENTSEFAIELTADRLKSLFKS
ncbi:MAG: ATP-binding protein [Rhizobacter sp.]|nr:ATP-binding protein [Bacteriovorax sp.]